VSEQNYWMRASRSRLSRRNLLASTAIGLAIAGGAGLVACGNRPSNKTANTGAGNVLDTPQPGGTFNGVLSYDAPLDPQKASASPQQVIGGVMSRVFRFKTGSDPNSFADHDVENDAGVSAESPDGVTWTIKLRPDVQFQNISPVNGHTLEAEDVRASFVRALDPATGNPNMGSLNMIDAHQIQTPDKQTLVFKLNYPYAPFQRTLASPAYSWIFPREILSGGYDPARTVIGSGPFLFESYTPNVAYTYKKNPAWFEKGRPYVDNLRVSVIPDPAQQLAQFSAANTDELLLTVDQLSAAKQQNPKAIVLKALDGRPSSIYFQFFDKSGPFQDLRVRQALSMAIDRDALSKAIYNGESVQPIFVPAYMGKWAVKVQDLPASSQQYFKYNPSEAKKLLEASGTTNFQFKFAYIVNSSFSTPVYIKQSEAVANMLNTVGIKTSIVTQDYIKDFIGGGKGSRQGYFDKDTMVFHNQAGFTEADEFIFSYFHSKSTSNSERLSDPTLDSMIDSERTIVNQDERLKAIQDIQKYIASKMYVVSTIGAFQYIALQPHVHNYNYTNSLGLETETYAKLWVR
jgi:peptide/nickel transport system substrate-binding protein